jgi:hypothetical protein
MRYTYNFLSKFAIKARSNTEPRHGRQRRPTRHRHREAVRETRDSALSHCIRDHRLAFGRPSIKVSHHRKGECAEDGQQTERPDRGLVLVPKTRSTTRTRFCFRQNNPFTCVAFCESHEQGLTGGLTLTRILVSRLGKTGLVRSDLFRTFFV